MRTSAGYPEARERASGNPPTAAERYVRYEEKAALAGTGGAFVEIGRFAGQPDAIDLVCTGGNALVQLTDETFAEETSVLLVANVPRETRISRRVVMASNVSDASPATVRATGKWLG